MPLSLRRGRVTAIVERLPELVRCEVDGVPCIAYPRLTGPVEEGDEVIVNVQARELGLGSGGFDVLHVNLTRGLELPAEPGAHVMKLPYTSLQHAVLHAEESGDLVEALDGMPVVCCSLHSQVVPVLAGLGKDVRVAYVQLPGGALPVSLSDAVRRVRGCRRCGWGMYRRGRPLRLDGIGARLGEGRGLRRSRVRDRPGHRRHRQRSSATEGWQRLKRRTQPWRSAAGRSSPCARPKQTSESVTGTSLITRRP